MRLGIFARTFDRPSLGETLDAVKAHGIGCVQFNMSCAGLPAMPEEISPELNNVVDSAEKGRRLLDEMRCPCLKVVMDAANLFREGELSHAEEVLDRAFGLLGEDIVVAHAKDVKNTGEVVAAGRGELDYVRYLNCLRGVGFEGSLILHNLAESEVEGSVAFLRARLGDHMSYSERRGR